MKYAEKTGDGLAPLLTHASQRLDCYEWDNVEVEQHGMGHRLKRQGTVFVIRAAGIPVRGDPDTVPISCTTVLEVLGEDLRQHAYKSLRHLTENLEWTAVEELFLREIANRVSLVRFES